MKKKNPKARMSVLTMIDPVLHHVARVAAATKQESLNRWICDAIQDAILRQADGADGEVIKASMKRHGLLRQAA